MNTSIAKPLGFSSATYDDFDGSNREFLPAEVSAQPLTSNISNNEFDLDDDSRQLSIDQSFPESHQSDNGKHRTYIRNILRNIIKSDNYL